MATIGNIKSITLSKSGGFQSPTSSTPTSSPTPNYSQAISKPSAPMSVNPSVTSTPRTTTTKKSSSQPTATGVSVIYNNPASGPVTDVKSGLQLQSGQGVINIAGGTTGGGVSKRTYFEPNNSDAAFGALQTGVQEGQRTSAVQTVGALGEITSTQQNKDYSWAMSKPSGSSTIFSLPESKLTQRSFLPGMVFPAAITTTQEAERRVFERQTELTAQMKAEPNLFKQLAIGAKREVIGFTTPTSIIGAAAFSAIAPIGASFLRVGTPFVASRFGLKIAGEKTVSYVSKGIGGLIIGKSGLETIGRVKSGEPVAGAIGGFGVQTLLATPFLLPEKLWSISRPPKPTEQTKLFGVPRTEEPILKPFRIIPEKPTPSSDIPLSLQRFRERQTPATSGQQQLIVSQQGVTSMASTQQIQRALRNLIIIQKPIMATEQKGLSSSLFSKLFSTKQQLIIEPTTEYAPRMPIREVITLKKPAALSKLNIVSATKLIPSTRVKQGLQLSTVQQSISTPKQALKTGTILKSSIVPRLDFGAGSALMIGSMVTTSQILEQPAPVAPILPPLFIPGIDLPGRRNDKSGRGSLFGRYTPNLRGVAGIKWGTSATRSQTKFTGLEVRPITFNVGTRQRRRKK